MREFLLALFLIFLGTFFRTVAHIAPNVEFVTTASFLAGAYLGKKYAVLVPLLIMVITDTLIGNTNIFIFTWSAYLTIGILGYWGLKNQKDRENFKIIRATGLGIIASFFFYLWTNFGVWLLDAWGMYTKDLNGLFKCYLMGLPFLKLNLLGNLFFIPVSFGIGEMIKSFYASKSWYLNFLFRR